MTTPRSIIESAQDAIFSKTMDGTITSWNAGAERMYGYTAEEAIGQNVNMLTPMGREDEIAGIMARLRQGEIIDHYVTKRRRKDGTLLDVSLGIAPIRDARGRVVAASTIARDVTSAVAGQQVRHRRQLLAYALIVLLGAVGFVRFGQISAKIDRESKARSYENCQAVIRTNTVLRTLVEKSAAPLDPPADSSPGLRQAFIDANKRSAEFKEFANGLLIDPKCDR